MPGWSGLPQRLEAYEKMLDHNANLRRRVHMLQVAPPSRDMVSSQYYVKDSLARDNAEAVARVETRLDFLATALGTPGQLSDYEVERVRQVESRARKLLQQYRSDR